MKTEKVRIGIIGYGNIAKVHMGFFDNNEIANAKVTAILDIDDKKIRQVKEKYGNRIKCFTNPDEFFYSDLIDAIIICTPHYFHPEYAITAFENNIHVLCEKPAGVYLKQVEKMNKKYEQHPHLVFSMMYNQRTNPIYKKVRDMVKSGEMGELRRCVWIITDWFRSQRYYDSGGWRATWAYEGGGVLLNQDPHQLDLWQWICGMPVKVRAFMGFGKFHDIEVEDDVTAYLEYANGATGVFITSTGEAPGTNRLELSMDKGKIVIENDMIKIHKLESNLKEYIKTTESAFTPPKTEYTEPEIMEESLKHKGIIINFVNAILYDERLIAPGVEGILGLTLSNAMHLSAWTDKPVGIPFDNDLFYKYLKEKIQSSNFIKKEGIQAKTDMSVSF